MWEESVNRKQKEYLELANEHFADLTYAEEKDKQAQICESMSPYEQENYLQIAIDVKWTCPCDAFANHRVKNMLTRTLFVWTFKHPASGYVQGINDLAATLLYVFLLDAIQEGSEERIALT